MSTAFNMSGIISLDQRQRELLVLLGFEVGAILPASQLEEVLDLAQAKGLGGTNRMLEEITQAEILKMRELLPASR